MPVTVTETSVLTPDHLTVNHKTITSPDGKVEVTTDIRAEGSGITTFKEDTKCKKLGSLWAGGYLTGGYLELFYCKGIDANKYPNKANACITLANLLVAISMGGSTNVISACKEVAPVPINMLQGTSVLGLGTASIFGAYGCYKLGDARFASNCMELTNHLVPVTASVAMTLISS